MRAWSLRLLRDPVLTVANTVVALAVTWLLTVLIGGWLVSLFDPVEGYWHGVYCAVGHMTTHGCDVEPTKGAGRFVSGALQVWGIIITASVVAHAIGSLIKDRNEFSDEEQQQLKESVSRNVELTRDLVARVETLCAAQGVGGGKWTPEYLEKT